MRSGDPELRPTGHARRCWLDGFALDDELWARFQIPIGLAFFMVRERGQAASSRSTRARPGATECELHLEAWDELVAANPVLDEPRARGRGADRQPPERAAALRDRADRPLLRAGRHDQGALGGHLRRHARSRTPSAAFFAPAAARGAARDAADAGGRGRGAIAPEFAVARRRASSRTRPRRRCASSSASTEPSGREVFTIALTAQINVEPARRELRRRATRERLVDLFGEPERWAATTHSFLWAHATTLVPSFTGATMFTLPVPCTYDLEVAAAQVLLQPARRRGAARASTSAARSCYRGDDGRVQVVLGAVVVLDARGACRSRPGAR